MQVELERRPLANASLQLEYLTLAALGLGDLDSARELTRRYLEEIGDRDCRSYGDSSECIFLARVYAQLGEHDAAIDLLEETLPSPSWLTVHLLDADPIWDPLREHPRFRLLLEQYASDVER